MKIIFATSVLLSLIFQANFSVAEVYYDNGCNSSESIEEILKTKQVIDMYVGHDKRESECQKKNIRFKTGDILVSVNTSQLWGSYEFQETAERQKLFSPLKNAYREANPKSVGFGIIVFNKKYIAELSVERVMRTSPEIETEFLGDFAALGSVFGSNGYQATSKAIRNAFFENTKDFKDADIPELGFLVSQKEVEAVQNNNSHSMKKGL